MIIEKQSEIEILEVGESKDSMKMSLDLESAHVLMNMLSKNLYSDAVGSTIRELTSNALDSHRKDNKLNTPIIVSLLPNEEGNYEFSVEDTGVGLDDNDVTNIISKYGKSTKRSDNQQLGMFGLGFKVGLAYSSSFYFVCRKNGMERKYMMYEGEDGNTIDLLYECETTECNGVKVIIPVKYEDRHVFFNKIEEQLAYFQNVFFNVYVQGSVINNEFKIHRTNNYQLSELNRDNYMHLCLDDVYYPIDFSKLGIRAIQIPIALRFGLSDGLIPVPSRESLLYSNKAKEIILNKIKIVAEELISKYNESIKEMENIKDIFNYYRTNSRFITIGHKSLDIVDLEMYSDVKIVSPTLKGVELLNLKDLYYSRDYILSEYRIKYILEKGSFREVKNKYSSEISISNINNDSYYLYENSIPGKIKTFLRETAYSYNSKNFVNKMISHTLFPSYRYADTNTNYYNILKLDGHPRSEWRNRIKEFQYIKSLLLKEFINLNDFVIPQQWLDDQKKKRISINNGGERRVKLQGEITCKEAQGLLVYNGNNCKFVSNTYKLSELYKQKCLFVYTTHDDKMKLDSLYKISKKQKIRFITFSDRDMKVIQNLNIHNLISYDKFMEGKNMPFKRIVTAQLITSLIYDNKNVFDKLEMVKSISNSLGETLEKLEMYKRDNYENSNGTIHTAMLEVAKQYNLFDENIYSEYMKINELLSKLSFLDVLCKNIRWYDYKEDKMYFVLVDMLKYHKHRIDYKHYNITLNEENVEVLTDEIIEELV